MVQDSQVRPEVKFPFWESDLWLNKILDRNVFRVTRPEEFDFALVAPLLDTGTFIYAKVPTSSLTGVSDFERNGFHLVDTLVSLTHFTGEVCDKASGSGRILVREATPNDEFEVRKIARTSFVYSRFHQDSNLSQGLGAKVKEEWIGNFFRGKRGDCLLVAEDLTKKKENIVGFNLLLEENTIRRSTSIDLIATAPECQRQGVGQELVRFSLKKYGKLAVGTQISNTASINLYLKLGFLWQKSEYIFHYHHKKEA